MIEMNNELITAMRRFKEVCCDVGLLREIPKDISK